MNNQDTWKELMRIIESYITMTHVELHMRWEKWPLDLGKREMYEVIGALLARQVTLATQLANAPTIWNGHIAPLILRTMIDTYITLAWILEDPVERSRRFILFGLGQEKLDIEHRKAQLVAEGKENADDDMLVNHKETWLNSQRYSFLTEVNIGSWSGLTTRKMAEEAKCLDFYNYAYTPFSAATHSMWHHIERYNLVACPNPLHRYHKIPINPSIETDVDYLYRAAKYVQKTFHLFDEKMSIEVDTPSALNELVQGLKVFNETGEQ